MDMMNTKVDVRESMRVVDRRRVHLEYNSIDLSSRAMAFRWDGSVDESPRTGFTNRGAMWFDDVACDSWENRSFPESEGGAVDHASVMGEGAHRALEDERRDEAERAAEEQRLREFRERTLRRLRRDAELRRRDDERRLEKERDRVAAVGMSAQALRKSYAVQDAQAAFVKDGSPTAVPISPTPSGGVGEASLASTPAGSSVRSMSLTPCKSDGCATPEQVARARLASHSASANRSAVAVPLSTSFSRSSSQSPGFARAGPPAARALRPSSASSASPAEASETPSAGVGACDVERTSLVKEARVAHARAERERARRYRAAKERAQAATRRREEKMRQDTERAELALRAAEQERNGKRAGALEVIHAHAAQEEDRLARELAARRAEDEAARFHTAMREEQVRRLELATGNTRIPPACPCGHDPLAVEDPVCANNCQFYGRPEMYRTALQNLVANSAGSTDQVKI